MKTFKHKTTGHIAKTCQGINNTYSVEDSFSFFNMPKEMIEKSLDWEEVIDKSYEILSFIHLKKDNLGIPFNEIRVMSKNSPSVNSYLNTGSSVKSGDWGIHAVKNLKTGETIKIGDRIENYIYPKKYNGKVTDIKITPDSECFLHYGINNIFDFLQTVKLARTSLFTTIDGVEVFEGDIYYSFAPINDMSKIVKHVVGYMVVGGFCPVGGKITFSTEIAAKNYKKENKKRFSLNDINKVLNFYTEQCPYNYVRG